MLSKALRIAFYGATGAFGANYVIDNHFQKEANSIGIIRFGRAALTVKNQHFFIYIKSKWQTN